MPSLKKGGGFKMIKCRMIKSEGEIHRKIKSLQYHRRKDLLHKQPFYSTHALSYDNKIEALRWVLGLRVPV